MGDNQMEFNMQPEDPQPVLEQVVAQLLAQVENLQHNFNVVQQQQQPVHDPSTSSSRLKPKTPETYDGSPNISVTNWLFQMRIFFRARGIHNEQEKVDFVISQLRGNAVLWWEQMESLNQREQIRDLEHFGEILTKQFQPINPIQVARDELSIVRQRSHMSVQDYTSEFRNIVLRIPDVSTGEQIDRFIRGLNSYRIQTEIFREMSLDPNLSFEAIVQLAERVEAGMRRIQHIRQVVPPSRNQPRRNTHYQRPTAYPPMPRNQAVPMELGNIQTQRHNSAGLRTEDRQRFVNEGRCFYCKERGHIAINCPKKKNRFQGNAHSR